VLQDRSLGMLRRGANGLQMAHFQADAAAMPFKQEAFTGVMSWGMLHVLRHWFAIPWPIEARQRLRQLRRDLGAGPSRPPAW